MKDLTGLKFERLVALSPTDKRYHGCVVWKCKCDCGKEVEVPCSLLLSKTTRSCGCLCHDVNSKLAKTGNSRRTHGMSKTKIYNEWLGIKKRCNNPNESNYANYGGRNIKLCEEWEKDFVAFFNYMSNLPHYGEEGYSIDRIDNDGNYEPGNVRWATRTQQNRNRRDSILYKTNGLVFTAKGLSELLGVNYGTLRSRHQQNRSLLKPSEKQLLLKLIKEKGATICK